MINGDLKRDTGKTTKAIALGRGGLKQVLYAVLINL